MLTAIRERMDGRTAAPAGPSAPVGAMLPVPPALPRLNALPPELAAAVRALAARHGLSDPGIVPSLYLHLALWPQVLAALPALLAPLFAGDALAAARAGGGGAGGGRGGGLIAAQGRRRLSSGWRRSARSAAIHPEVIPEWCRSGWRWRRAMGRR